MDIPIKTWDFFFLIYRNIIFFWKIYSLSQIFKIKKWIMKEILLWIPGKPCVKILNVPGIILILVQPSPPLPFLTMSKYRLILLKSCA